MRLKIVTPTETLLDRDDIKQVTLDTTEGSYGFLPRRLDCVSALVPGILTFTTDSQKEGYVGLGEGLLFKEGSALVVSARQAVYSEELGRLQKNWHNFLKEYRQKEENTRRLLQTMQSNIRIG